MDHKLPQTLINVAGLPLPIIRLLQGCVSLLRKFPFANARTGKQADLPIWSGKIHNQLDRTSIYDHLQ